MRRTNFFVLVAAIVCAVGMATGQVVVTEINSNSDATDDWFELTNIGAAAVDLTGWMADDYPEDIGNAGELRDDAGGGITAEAGESVIFVQYDSDLGGTFADQIALFRTAWGGLAGVKVGMYQGSGLGRDDGVSIFNSAGTLVAQEIYFDPDLDPPADLHAGQWVGATNIDSAIWDPNSGTPSITTPAFNSFIAPQAGQMGVFAASDGGLGSPGAVVPEPNSLALLVFGAALWCCRHR